MNTLENVYWIYFCRLNVKQIMYVRSVLFTEPQLYDTLVQLIAKIEILFNINMPMYTLFILD